MTAAKFNLGSIDGQPKTEEKPILFAFADSVEYLLKDNGPCTHVGDFTRNGVKINYFYVGDTIGLRQKFISMYARCFPTYNLGLKLKHEKTWETYFEFLYPGDEIIKNIKEREKEKLKSK